jgi:uncharacterized protein
MTKRSVTVSIAIVLLTLLPHSAAFAQSADLVLCDRIAADPNDPDKPKEVKGAAVIAPSDVATAIKFCKVASTSSRRAMYQLGRAYAANRQTAEAIGAYRKAADKGNTSAMVELGVMYGTGAGVAKDQAKARELFERAAKAGNPRGVTNLAVIDGGTTTNPAEARAMLAKAAEANSAEAQFQLGVMYAQGTGGPKDEVAARALFEKAAAQNHPGALEWLGAFAQSGLGGGGGSPATITSAPRRSAMRTPRRRSSASTVPTCSRTSAARSGAISAFNREQACRA